MRSRPLTNFNLPSGQPSLRSVRTGMYVARRAPAEILKLRQERHVKTDSISLKGPPAKLLCRSRQEVEFLGSSGRSRLALPRNRERGALLTLHRLKPGLQTSRLLHYSVSRFTFHESGFTNQVSRVFSPRTVDKVVQLC